MANRAYAAFWCNGFSAGTILRHLGQFLSTLPYSSAWPGATSLVVRAVDSTETPLEELDLRAHPATPAELIELAGDYPHPDCCYEVSAQWDLWVLDAGEWKPQPQPIEVICYGPEYDSGICGEAGHFSVDLGFEHLFTGHAGLLSFSAAAGGRTTASQHPTEIAFVRRMSEPGNLRVYQEKTRQNVRTLLGWMEKAQAALPLERYRLWSEGEGNFEARLDEILALH